MRIDRLAFVIALVGLVAIAATIAWRIAGE
jgi:hypothetical protein